MNILTYNAGIPVHVTMDSVEPITKLAAAKKVLIH